MSKINLYVVFEHEICNICSVADGQSLYDLIHFRIGETVELYSSYGSHFFTVLKVHHSLSSRQNISQYVKIMLRQIPLTSNEFRWSY